MIVDGIGRPSIVRNLSKEHPRKKQGEIAQLVEQRTENPCVPGSIPGLATTFMQLMKSSLQLFFCTPENPLKL